jgi:hypothetical protein
MNVPPTTHGRTPGVADTRETRLMHALFGERAGAE